MIGSRLEIKSNRASDLGADVTEGMLAAVRVRGCSKVMTDDEVNITRVC